ncbi:hypothetical protein [Streptomyces prunicolor]|uniref:hypothetical protein n=1 Tax=Streptomyces prunicolor TaxID=67348 RepID=UPI0038701573
MTGRRILDAGRGAGPLFAALCERGAVVTGIDSSAGMPAPGCQRRDAGAGEAATRPLGGSATTWPCAWSTCAPRCRSITVCSTTWSRH